MKINNVVENLNQHFQEIFRYIQMELLQRYLNQQIVILDQFYAFLRSWRAISQHYQLESISQAQNS